MIRGEIILFSVLFAVVNGQLGTLGPLTEASASEGSCTTPPGQLASNLNLAWISSIPKWYISFGSREFWIQNAEVCLGRQVSNFPELQRMCFHMDWDLNSTMTCYNKKIHQSCNMNQNNGNPFVSCIVTQSDPGTAPVIFSQFTKRVILTDNSSYALFVRCTNSQPSYYLATTTPIVPVSLLGKVIFAIRQLGFNPRLFTYIGAPRRLCGSEGFHYGRTGSGFNSY